MKYLQCVLSVFFIFAIMGCDKVEKERSLFEPITVGEFSDDWTCSINKGSGSNFDLAMFRLWVPNPMDVSNLKAILVLAGHYNDNGLPMALTDEWRGFSRNNNIGILAVRLESHQAITMNDSYVMASGGSGEALLLALKAISERNNIPTVASLPFLMRGYSGGGMFCYSFSTLMHPRVVAFANIRGPILRQTVNENINIPGLFLFAEYDDPSSINSAERIVLACRVQNGLWSFALEPKINHFGNLTASDELIKLFFSKALKRRMSNGNKDLLPVLPASGWLGDNISKAFFPYSTYPTNMDEASWLIDEEFAIEWKKYQIE